jgi:glycerol-3-phosphate dehydrogenase subunit B
MNDREVIDCELTVIGAGIAGMAAALFSVNRGIPTVQVGRIGEIIFSTGLLDLMGVHPIGEKRVWEDPWAAIDALSEDIPNHPYILLGKEKITSAFSELLESLGEAGLYYEKRGERNSLVLTSEGTVKPSYLVPGAMWNGVCAFRDKTPCLIADFQGLKGFSSRRISMALKQRWQGLRAANISFPQTGYIKEIYPEQMARWLDLSEKRQQLVDLLRPHIGGFEAVGLPAVVGIYRSNQAMAELQDAIGLPVFEIPTMPPSVPAIRLKEAFTTRLYQKGARLFHQKKVLEVSNESSGRFMLVVGRKDPELTIRTKGIILASGRFLGGGLHAGREDIREAIFNLPVYQPADRASWHRKGFMDAAGHPVNQVGLEVDDRFRVIDKSGGPVFENLYAAGSILAHQDWMRMKCGSGLSISTAFGAVESFSESWNLPASRSTGGFINRTDNFDERKIKIW